MTAMTNIRMNNPHDNDLCADMTIAGATPDKNNERTDPSSAAAGMKLYSA